MKRERKKKQRKRLVDLWFDVCLRALDEARFDDSTHQANES